LGVFGHLSFFCKPLFIARPQRREPARLLTISMQSAFSDQPGKGSQSSSVNIFWAYTSPRRLVTKSQLAAAAGGKPEVKAG
jgi:hypothetical protein